MSSKIFQRLSLTTSRLFAHTDTHAPIRRRKFGIVALAAVLAAPLSVYAWNDSQAAANDSQSSNQQSHTQSLNIEAKHHSTGSTTAGQTNSSQTSISVDNHMEQSASSAEPSVRASAGDAESRATVTINGQTLRLPANGSIHKHVRDDSGSTSVDVSVQGAGSGAGNSNNSSINLQITNDSVSASGEEAAP